MEFKHMKCPACGSHDLIELDIDTFKCDYCGMSFIMNGRDDNVIDYKKRVKELESETEQLQKKLNVLMAQTKMAYDDAEKERKTIIPRAFAGLLRKESPTVMMIGFLVFFFLLVGLLTFWSNYRHSLRVKELEKTIVEIQQDIDEGNFDEALIKTESIRGNNFSSEDTERWDNTRNSLIKQIEEAKAKANNYTIIAMPESSARYIGETYESVVSKLTSAGFTNIVTKKADKKAGLFHSAGDVKEISVQGAMSFEKGEEFHSTAEIVIYYYSD